MTSKALFPGPFEELNLWQRIFAEHWEEFARRYEQRHGRCVPENWQENVEKMLSCGDIREGYYEYFCQECGATKKVGFTCKSRLCLRCFPPRADLPVAECEAGEGKDTCISC